MVTQTTMGTQGIGNTSVPEPDSSLSRQGSFYGLTLDEVQSQMGNLGKPLGGMNLDELLRTAWTGEAIDNAASDPAHLAPGSSLNWQSSFSMSRDLSKKTAEEVWKEIQMGKRSRNDGERSQERQATYGEMTLEDFLAQAGVGVENDGEVNSNAGSGLGGDPNASHHALWTQYQMLPQVSMFMPNQHIQQQSIIASRGLPLADSAYSDASMSPSALMVTPSDAHASGRKRVGCGDVGEKTVEMRQKRMIKNRESAARSRLRKQAYTHELENKVSRLEEENESLRKLMEVDHVLPAAPPPEPKYQLRRTSSAPY